MKSFEKYHSFKLPLLTLWVWTSLTCLGEIKVQRHVDDSNKTDKAQSTDVLPEKPAAGNTPSASKTRDENIEQAAELTRRLIPEEKVREFTNEITQALLRDNAENPQAVEDVVNRNFSSLSREQRNDVAALFETVKSSNLTETLEGAKAFEKKLGELLKDPSVDGNSKERTPEEQKELAELNKQLEENRKEREQQAAQQAAQQQAQQQQQALANALGGGKGGGGGGESFKPNNNTNSQQPTKPPEQPKFSDIKDALKDVQNQDRKNQRGFNNNNSNAFQNSNNGNNFLNESEKNKQANGGGFKLPEKKVGDTGLSKAASNDKKDATPPLAEENPPIPNAGKTPLLTGPTSIPESIATQYASSSGAFNTASGGGSADSGGLGGASLAGGKTGSAGTGDGAGAGFDSVGRMELPPLEPPLRRIQIETGSASAGGDDGDSEGGSGGNDYTTPKMVKNGQGLFVNQLVMTAGNNLVRGRGIMAFTGTMRDICSSTEKGKIVGLCKKQQRSR